MVLEEIPESGTPSNSLCGKTGWSTLGRGTTAPCTQGDSSYLVDEAITFEGGPTLQERAGVEGLSVSNIPTDTQTDHPTAMSGGDDITLPDTAPEIILTVAPSVDNTSNTSEGGTWCEDYLQHNRTMEEEGRSPISTLDPIITQGTVDDVQRTQVQRGESSSSITSAVVNKVNISEPQVNPGLSQIRKSCIYTKRGRCKEHGEGAKSHYRPIIRKEQGPDGKMLRHVTKKLKWECDLGPDGKKRTQTRLSFTKTKLKMTLDNEDDTQEGYLGISPFMTSTEGQSVEAGTVQTGSDEK